MDNKYSFHKNYNLKHCKQLFAFLVIASEIFMFITI